MDKRYNIRLSILNLNLKQWDALSKISKDNIINVSILDFYSLVGIGGSMFFSARANDSEKEFMDNFYKKFKTMDRIDIEDFKEEIVPIYHWICTCCHSKNHEFESPEFTEAVSCNDCGNVFEIINN